MVSSPASPGVTEVEPQRATPEATATAAGGWEALPDAPLDGLPRAGASSAWTGHELAVWGGYGAVVGHCGIRAGDGAVLDVGGRSWRRALSPLLR